MLAGRRRGELEQAQSDALTKAQDKAAAHYKKSTGVSMDGRKASPSKKK